MTMGVDATRKNEMSARVDGLHAAGKVFGERNNLAAGNSHVTAADATCCGNGAAADDEVEGRHAPVLYWTR